MPTQDTSLLQGTLDMLILKGLRSSSSAAIRGSA
jgi:hypothetical protein